MSTPPPGDPLNEPYAAHWLFGADMPDELGGGFVAGQLLLRTDGTLLRRYSSGGPDYGPWDTVPGWTPQPNVERAAAALHYNGYDLHPAGGPPPRYDPDPRKAGHD